MVPRAMPTPALSPAFLDAIRAGFSPEFASTDPDDLTTFGRDWTKVYAPAASLVCFPSSTAEVSKLLRICSEHRVPVVPSGGRTGLAGGAMATRGEVVLSLSKLRKMDEVDLAGATVRVQAGAVTEAVHQHVARHGFTWPVDFASKGSSTVGGNIATNAGGVRVIRYGLTRQWVLGLTVVLMDGTVLELNGALEKNNTGLDLRQLFIGTEGTLGVVTEAVLKLAKLPGKTDVLLFAVPDLAGVLSLFRAARAGPFTIMAFEFFTDRCLARVKRHRGLDSPIAPDSSHFVLLETESADDTALDAWIAAQFEAGRVLDGTLAKDPQQAKELWSLRESISESLSATGLPHKNDIALPVAALEGFCARLDALFAANWPGTEICNFGHIGDGNLHVNVMKPDGEDKADFLARTGDADAAMFALVKEFGGSISAEHGIGLLKKPYLSWSRTPAELALFAAHKRTFDPAGLLNPGKILD